jgi:tetratricopeptide (TPR) repeat protein
MTVHRFLRCTVLFLGGLGAAIAPAAEAKIADLTCGMATRINVSVVTPDIPVPVATLRVFPDSDGDAVLIGEEMGTDVEWREEGERAFHPVDTRPPRYGLFALRVRKPRRIELRAVPGVPHPATVAVRLECRPEPATRALPECLSRLDQPPPPNETNWCAALRLHAAASAASKHGDLGEAVRRYGDAAAAWAVRGDSIRAAAARLGEAESLVRLGRYKEGLVAADTATLANRRAGNLYFAARAQAEACVAKRELGDRDAARQCLLPLPAQFIALGESGEAASTYYNLGSIADEDGDRREASRLLTRARKLDLRAVYPEIRARLDLLEASLAAQQGRLPAAMAALDAAAVIFEQTGNNRWVANVHLELARLYAELGAWPESRAFAQDALVRLKDMDLPARHAEAWRVLGSTYEEAREPDLAMQAYLKARALAEAAPMVALTIDLDLALAGDADALARTGSIADSAGLSEKNAARLALGRARSALDQHLPNKALDYVRSLRPDRLDLQDYLALRRFEALAHVALRHADKAFELLEREITTLRRRAGAAGAAGLRQIAGRHLQDLRRTWVDVYLSLVPDQRPSPERLWAVLRDTQLAELLAPRPLSAKGIASAEAADKALSAALIGAHPEAELLSPDGAQRRLVKYYASLGEPVGAQRQTIPQALDSLRLLLDKGALLIAPGFGSSRGVLLIVTGERTEVREIDGAVNVHQAVVLLHDAIVSPDTPLTQVSSAQVLLSHRLFGSDLGASPSRLFFLSDPVLDGTPLSLLIWPGATTPLLDTSVVTILPSAPRSLRRPKGPPARIEVIAESNLPRSGALELATLPGAQHEPRWIAGALPQTVVEIAPIGSGATWLTQALGRPREWLHVATHGVSRGPMQSYSGIWLTGRDSAEFFSWLDAADSPAYAAVAVLDACALGASEPRTSTGAASFAAAVSAAGVDDVVAALWPVSDGASAIWVPAFYEGLSEGGQSDIGESLRQAQIKLRATAPYRHPFYWASLVHFSR